MNVLGIFLKENIRGLDVRIVLIAAKYGEPKIRFLKPTRTFVVITGGNNFWGEFE